MDFGADTDVHVIGYSGLFMDLDGLRTIGYAVNTFLPDLVILELGTNDLVNEVPPRDLAQSMQNLVRELTVQISVRLVVLCQVVCRRKTRNCPTSLFDTNRLAYSVLIQQAARRNRRLYVFKHDLVNLHSTISKDEIHVTSPGGLRLYHHSIRRACVIGLNRLRDLH